MGSFSYLLKPTRKEQIKELTRQPATGSVNNFRREGLYRGHVVNVVRHVTMRGFVSASGRDWLMAYVSCSESEASVVERESINLLGHPCTFIGPAGPWQAPGARIANSGVEIHGNVYVGYDMAADKYTPDQVWYELGRLCDMIDESVFWEILDHGE